jgi:hypothetical protein
MRSYSKIISICLIGLGALTWSLTARPLIDDPDLDVPLNPLGINRSPYGEVFAMAMQSPIDTYFHAAMGESHHHDGGEHSHDHDDHSHDHDDHSHDHDDHSHDHDDHSHDHDDHSHDHEAHSEAVPTSSKKTSGKEATTLHERLLGLLEFMDEAKHIRTNPKPASASMRFHHRRETENKLRFAYNLDPAHYGNYNALHFFLTEPKMGTRPQLTFTAAQLAEETIHYCLKQENDPRPTLTAAAACTNILHLYFMDYNVNRSSAVSGAEMRKVLILLDHCLGRYDLISKRWEDSGNWALLSPLRIKECKDRHKFISKIREAAAQTISRIESEERPAQ